MKIPNVLVLCDNDLIGVEIKKIFSAKNFPVKIESSNLYDDLSVACYWTERYQEGLNYLNQILDLPSFANESERLLLNVQHFKNRMES